MDNVNELLPIVDEAGNVFDSERRDVCHNGSSFLLHPVVHLHLFDKSGRLLLQKRSANKRIQPGRWDTAVGGHVGFGESVLSAIKRETTEEIGYKINDASQIRPIAQYVFKSAVERELINCFMSVCSDDFTPVISEPEDIDELKFWEIKDLKQLSSSNPDLFTPNFINEFYKILLPLIESHGNK